MCHQVSGGANLAPIWVQVRWLSWLHIQMHHWASFKGHRGRSVLWRHVGFRVRGGIRHGRICHEIPSSARGRLRVSHLDEQTGEDGSLILCRPFLLPPSCHTDVCKNIGCCALMKARDLPSRELPNSPGLTWTTGLGLGESPAYKTVAQLRGRKQSARCLLEVMRKVSIRMNTCLRSGPLSPQSMVPEYMSV